MVGIGNDGKVTAVCVISHSETPSLGAVAAEDSSKGQAFRDQFAGVDKAVTVGADIDAITGATITSKAVAEGVNLALEYVGQLG